MIASRYAALCRRPLLCLLLACLTAVAGCGYKGPLTMPPPPDQSLTTPPSSSDL